MRFLSARQAIHDSYNYSLMKNAQDTDPTARIQFTAKGAGAVNMLQFEASTISRVVKGLPNLLRFWAEFAYADAGLRPRTGDYLEAQQYNLSRKGFDYLVVCIAFEARRESGASDVKPQDMPKWASLAKLCAKEMSAREWERNEDAGTEEKARAVKLGLPEYENSPWDRRYEIMRRVCDNLARRSLAPVAAKLNERRELEDEVA